VQLTQGNQDALAAAAEDFTYLQRGQDVEYPEAGEPEANQWGNKTHQAETLASGTENGWGGDDGGNHEDVQPLDDRSGVLTHPDELVITTNEWRVEVAFQESSSSNYVEGSSGHVEGSSDHVGGCSDRVEAEIANDEIISAGKTDNRGAME
jgi:hypothetical protein